MTPHQPPPMPAHQANLKDESHLNLLSVLHYVLGGLTALGVLFLVFHFAVMAFVFKEMGSKQAPAPPKAVAVYEADAAESIPAEEEIPTAAVPSARANTPPPFPGALIWIISTFYILMGAWIVVLTTCNILSAIWLKKRKNHLFSMITAGLNCTSVPLGTVLGVFTFIVLSRTTVKMSYSAKLET